MVWEWLDIPSISGHNCVGGFKKYEGLVIDDNTGRLLQKIEVGMDSLLVHVCEKVVYLDGRLVVPAPQDAHIHVSMLGESVYHIDFSSCFSIQQMQEMIIEHNEMHPDLEWIVGIKWDQSKIGRLPNCLDLDECGMSKPIFLFRGCWHIGVANSRAMEVLLPTTKTSDSSNELTSEFMSRCDIEEFLPSGGSVDYFESEHAQYFCQENQQHLPIPNIKLHSPSGIMRERACDLVSPYLETKDPVLRLSIILFDLHSLSSLFRKKFILDGLKECLNFGITSVQTNDIDGYSVYKQLEEENMIPMRVILTPSFNEIDEGLEDFNSDIWPTNEQDEEYSQLLINRVKIFSDGSLGAETASMRLPYPKHGDKESGDDKTEEEEDNFGMLLIETERLKEMDLIGMEKGFKLEIHAIGDGAVDQVTSCWLETIEQFNKTRPVRRKPLNIRHVLTHCQIIGDEAMLNQICLTECAVTIQPSFVPTDSRWAAQRIQQEAMEYSYCWKSMMEKGVICAGSSDAPVEIPNPFLGMFDAMARLSCEDKEYLEESVFSWSDINEGDNKEERDDEEETDVKKVFHLDKFLEAYQKIEERDSIQDPSVPRPAPIWHKEKERLSFDESLYCYTKSFD